MGSLGRRGSSRPADSEAITGRCRRNGCDDRNRATLAIAAIDVETKLLLDVWLSPRRGTDPAAEFLGRLAGKHDLLEATFLVDGMGYLIALARCDFHGHLDYVERNLIKKWFQTLAMRIDRFYQIWMGLRASAQRWLTAFVHYYNRHRPNQALENRTLAEEVMNR